jgi:hypothetical protein
MTAPRPVQHTVPFEADDEAFDAPESDVSQAARPDSQYPPVSSRAQMAQVLEGLQKQLAAPRTPLLPSMDLYQSVSPPQQKSIVDTLPPMESVPPPAPFPSEAPPPRPSVVPPVRQPRVNPPPGAYSAPVRQSNPPPSIDSERERLSSAPPPRESVPPHERFTSNPPRERFSSAPPPNSSNRVVQRNSYNPPSPYAATAPQPISEDALRRQAPTIPADSRGPSYSQSPEFDPNQPLPSLRVPSFAPEAYGTNPIRNHENRRLGSVAFALLVGLLILTGAIMGVNYAAKGSQKDVVASQTVDANLDAPKVKLERLAPNAVVAPPLASQKAGSSQEVSNAPAKAGDFPSPQAKESASNRVEPTSIGSPFNNGVKLTPKSRTVSPKNKTATVGGRKRIDPKSVDTETPLIMD